MGSILRLDGVALTIGDRETGVVVLDGFDLSVGESECVALVGPSGSGKTTVLHIAAGLRLPDEGSVRVERYTLEARDDHSWATLRARRFGMVFQAFHLLPHLSAVENVALPVLIAGDTRQRATELARESLARVGLASRATHLPSALSGGEQQRVAVARAVVNRPRLVLADEPTGNLDSVTTLAVARLLTGLARAGTAVLVATHDQRVAALADRVVELGLPTR